MIGNKVAKAWENKEIRKDLIREVTSAVQSSQIYLKDVNSIKIELKNGKMNNNSSEAGINVCSHITGPPAPCNAARPCRWDQP